MSSAVTKPGYRYGSAYPEVSQAETVSPTEVLTISLGGADALLIYSRYPLVIDA
jgi:hypothetical protein